MDAISSLVSLGRKDKKIYKYEIKRYINDYLMMIVTFQKNVRVIREDHTFDGVNSYPFAYIILDNKKEHQFIAVQESYELHASTIIKRLEKSLQKILIKNYLTVKITPIYKESDFWVFAQKNEGKIISLSFSLITPNMSNISSLLSEDLKRTAKSTAAIETNLTLNSASDSSLHLRQDNEELNGLVNYAAQGGGEISAKIKGSKLKFYSNDYHATMEIDELELKGDLDNLTRLIQDKIKTINR